MKGMITKETTIHKCKYCKKIYFRKIYAEKHHLKCRKSPENSSQCIDCFHLEKKKFEVLYSNSHSEGYEPMKSFYCNKKQIWLKPRWAGAIDEYFIVEELPEIKKMPKKCNLHGLNVFFKY